MLSKIKLLVGPTHGHVDIIRLSILQNKERRLNINIRLEWEQNYSQFTQKVQSNYIPGT